MAPPPVKLPELLGNVLVDVTFSAIEAVFADVMPVGSWANDRNWLSLPFVQTAPTDVIAVPHPLAALVILPAAVAPPILSRPARARPRRSITAKFPAEHEPGAGLPSSAQ